MKAISISLLAGALTVVACAAESTAKTLKQCPNGHPTLKDVPIVYGLPPPAGPAALEWEKGLRNLDFVPGGCVSISNSPKHQVICTTCRFAHSVYFTTMPESGSWTRRSSDVASFATAISDLAKSFPVPTAQQLEAPVSFTQSLSNQLKVTYESVGYRTTTPADQLEKEINDWIKAKKITCGFTTHNGAKRDLLQWENIPRWETNILERKTRELSVSIMLCHEHSDKSSWVTATFYK